MSWDLNSTYPHPPLRVCRSPGSAGHRKRRCPQRWEKVTGQSHPQKKPRGHTLSGCTNTLSSNQNSFLWWDGGSPSPLNMTTFHSFHSSQVFGWVLVKPQFISGCMNFLLNCTERHMKNTFTINKHHYYCPCQTSRGSLPESDAIGASWEKLYLRLV